jgi:predicted DNA-binding antitoxin AbrB/MazE fold protein
MQGKERLMTERVTAVYEHGVLRPLTPLHLPESSQVEIEVRSIHSTVDALSRREQVRAALDAAGILAPARLAETAPLSEEERAALAEELATPGAMPLSQTIIDDRDER